MSDDRNDPALELERAQKRIRDLEDRLQAERSMRRVVEAFDEVVYILSPDGTIEYASPSVERLLGIPAERLVGGSFVGLVHPEDLARSFDRFRRVLAGSTEISEYRVLRSDGSARWVQTTSTRVVDDHGRVAVQGILTDITERKLEEIAFREREEQLRHAAKMQAIGQLAGGVAHDFNNLLQVIVGYTAVAAAATGPGGAGRAELERIAEAAGRASELVRQLLTFSRREPMVREPADLDRLVTATASMLRRLLGEQLALDLDLKADDAVVCVDRGQLEQVLMNLCLNARDAMPDGGRICIRTGRRTVAADEPEVQAGVEPGDFVLITVADEGVGMAPEVLRRAVEPFFTTKPAGLGSGLGLATAYAIVERHGGVLELESEPGVGTTARLLLPIAFEDVPAEHREAAEPPRRPPPSRPTTVLVAEDEPVVRALVVDILQEFGYQVLEAEDGLQAVELATAGGQVVDVAVLDVVMPRLGGHGAAEALRELSPDLPVLFVTGYDQEAATGPTAITGPPVATLAKPFRPAELVDQLERLLDERAGGQHDRPSVAPSPQNSIR